MKKMIFALLMLFFTACSTYLPTKDIDPALLHKPTSKVGILVTQGDEALFFNDAGVIVSKLYKESIPGLNSKIEQKLRLSLQKAGINNVITIPNSEVNINRFFYVSSQNDDYMKSKIKSIMESNGLNYLIVVRRVSNGGLEYKTDTGLIPIEKLNSDKMMAGGVIFEKVRPFFKAYIRGNANFYCEGYYLDKSHKLYLAKDNFCSKSEEIGTPDELWKEDGEPTTSEINLMANKIDGIIQKAMDKAPKVLHLVK